MTSTDERSGTISTMAAIAQENAERHKGVAAARYKQGDGWAETTYDDLWDRVHDLAAGLVDLGIAAGDRVCILANTRFEWTVANLAASSAGAVVVPIYPTNSPDECAWVLGDSGAKAVFCENAEAVAKVQEVRGELPELEHIIVIDGEVDDLPTMASVAERGAGVDDAELQARIEAVTNDDAYLIIYTSGTTGRPKGVVLTHGGFGVGRELVTEMGIIGAGDVVYLFLPLAHVFAQVIQADTLEAGATLAYFGGDTTQIVKELGEVKPTFFPSVPRIFEKIYSMATGMVTDENRADFEAAIDAGVRVHQAKQNGEEPSAEDEKVLAAADELMFGFVRSLFGGEMRFALTGAAPIAPEILRFFYAAGAPVFEGWGMTETTALGTINLPDAFKFGSIGKAVPGTEMRIADDGEIMIRGPVVFREYWNNPDATKETIQEDGWMHTGDLGSVDEDGYYTITGRKKDIIITAGGKNLTPANLEGDLRQSQWISQAVMYGDRKPYPVALITLDPDTIVPWAEKQGLPTDIAELAKRDEVKALIQADLDAANKKYAKVEQIKKFEILPADFSQDSGELTPTLKLKRNVVYENYADEIANLYSS